MCSSVIAKFRNKLTRTDSSSSISTIKAETSSIVKSSDKVIAHDTSQNYEDVVDISRGSVWDVPHQTDQLEETMSKAIILFKSFWKSKPDLSLLRPKV